jgi:hypothetical protein
MPRATPPPNATPLLRAVPPQSDQQQLDASVAAAQPGRHQPARSAAVQQQGPESADTVEQWLSSHALERYTEAVVEAGYGNLVALSTMSDAEQERLVTTTKMKTPHKRVFKVGIATLKGNATFASGSNAVTATSVQAYAVMSQPVVSPASPNPTANGQSCTAPNQAAAPPIANVRHRRLAARAAAGNRSLAQQRARDKLKHDQEAKCAGVWATFSCVGLWAILQNTYCVPENVCPCSEFTTCPGMVGCPTPTQCAGCGPADGPYPGGCQFPPLSSCGKTEAGMDSCFVDGNAGTVIVILAVAFVIKAVIYLRCMRTACRTDDPPWDSAIDHA